MTELVKRYREEAGLVRPLRHPLDPPLLLLVKVGVPAPPRAGEEGVSQHRPNPVERVPVPVVALVEGDPDVRPVAIVEVGELEVGVAGPHVEGGV